MYTERPILFWTYVVTYVAAFIVLLLDMMFWRAI